MRNNGNISFYTIVLTLLLTHSFTGYTQIDRSLIRKHHKMSVYRGFKKDFGNKIYNALGLSVSGLNYFGDLAPHPQDLSTDLSLTRPGFGLSFVRKRGPRFSLKAEFMFGVIRGDDKKSADPSDENGIYRYKRNASFRNYIKEFSFVVSFDLYENSGFYFHRPAWTPYVFGGVAVFLHNPQGKVPATDLHGKPLSKAGKWIRLRPLGTEGQFAKLEPGDINYGIKPYKTFQLSLPFGAGLRFRISHTIDLSAELGLRYLFTDYIDDVSRNYIDLGLLGSELARAMSYRSNEAGTPSNPYTYTGRDGGTYTVESGYGHEHAGSLRGNRGNNDFIAVTTLRLTTILGANIHSAKSR